MFGSIKIRILSVATILLSFTVLFVSAGAINNAKEEDEIHWIPIEECADDDNDLMDTAGKKTVFLVRSSNNPNESLTISIQNPEELTSIEYITEPYSHEEEEVILTVTADELVAWAFRAIEEGWEYTTGGCEPGHVDCSGLIKSCVEVCARGTEELLAESPQSGEIGTIPEIPGLGVYYPGHVGIYVGDGMVIDARTEAHGIGYDAIDYEGWVYWFEVKGVDYSAYQMGSE